MGESKQNPNSIAKSEGKREGFASEIRDIAIVTRLALIGLEGLKVLTDEEKGENKQFIDMLLELGPATVAKFEETGKYLFERANPQSKEEAQMNN